MVQGYAKRLLEQARTSESKSYAHTLYANIHFSSCPDSDDKKEAKDRSKSHGIVSKGRADVRYYFFKVVCAVICIARVAGTEVQKAAH